MNDKQNDDYLWNPTAPPDADVERLESALRPLRHQGQPPDLPERRPRRVHRPRAGRTVPLAWLAAAALVAGVFWWLLPPALSTYAIESFVGDVRVDGTRAELLAQLHAGQEIQCGAESSAELAVGPIGNVSLEEHTRLRIQKSGNLRRRDEYEVYLARGTI